MSLVSALGFFRMTGPQSAGRPWTQAEEAQLRELIGSKVNVGLIAKKLKRSPGAIYARINSFKKMPRELAFGEQPRSLPSQRLAHARAPAKSCDVTEGT
jgi:hypothetical protein